MAYTTLRTSSLVGGRWEEFEGLEGDEPVWRVPANRMKGKRRNKKEHIVPLAPQAVAILAELRRENPRSEYVFPGQGKAKHMSTGTILHALTRMGYRGPGMESIMTGHGWRSVASTALHENGWEHALVEMQLAHEEQSEVSASYKFATRSPERRRMMAWYAEWIDRQAGKIALAQAAD
jgi:integrase